MGINGNDAAFSEGSSQSVDIVAAGVAGSGKLAYVAPRCHDLTCKQTDAGKIYLPGESPTLTSFGS